MAQRLMDMDTEGCCGADHDEKNLSKMFRCIGITAMNLPAVGLVQRMTNTGMSEWVRT